MNKTVALYAALAVAAAGAVAALVYFGRSALSTKGTAYEGSGAAGVLGNVFDKASGGTLHATGEALGGAVYDWLNPPAIHAGLTYTVLFPDGARHAINAEDISSAGYFQGKGDVYPWNVDPGGYGAYRWRIGTNTAAVRVAVPA